MSQVKIKRLMRDVPITLHSTTSLATTLRLEDMAGAVVTFGTMSTNAATLHIWMGTATSSAFSRLYNADGSASNITLAASTNEGRSYALPDAVFAAPYIKILSATTNSTGSTGIVSFKS